MNINNIKAFFFDIDGTLFDNKKQEIPQSTIKTLKALHQKGYKLYIATSRCLGEMNNVASFLKEIPFTGMVSGGGAMIHHHDKLVEVFGMNQTIVNKVIDYCEENNESVRYQSNDECCIDLHLSDTARKSFIQFYDFVPLVKKYNRQCDIVNLLVFNSQEHYHKILNMHLDVDMILFPDAFEITCKGINKASGIEYLAKLDNFISEEIIAFGDGENDVNMLEKVHIGVAMGNGCQALKDVADYITSNVDDNGIYNACQHLGFLK